MSMVITNYMNWIKKNDSWQEMLFERGRHLAVPLTRSNATLKVAVGNNLLEKVMELIGSIKPF